VFEPNDDRPTPSHSRQVSGIMAPVPAVVAPMPEDHTHADPDVVVTQTHWQRTTGFDTCADPMCGKRLGGSTGQVNCRHCGKLFCEEHTMYQMKLSRAAIHEPTRGLWCRVCETCYKTRAGYNDHTGLERNHFDFFHSTRRRTVDKQNLEVSRLETRLTRLTHLLANPPPEPTQSAGNFLWSSISGTKPQIRALEQSIVSWEDDMSVPECPFCQQSFTQYTFRRRHCRICGRVVCGDPATNCSTDVGLDVAKGKCSGGAHTVDEANQG
jgi:rabenosyn-5